MNSVSWESRIGNPKGVHCRVATRLIEIIDAHDANVQITNRGEPVDCSSILEILGLALVHGSQVRFTAQGPDAHKVAAAVDCLLSDHAANYSSDQASDHK
jgi:phosphotransferase system HPr (HPr) family protein